MKEPSAMLTKLTNAISSGMLALHGAHLTITP